MKNFLSILFFLVIPAAVFCQSDAVGRVVYKVGVYGNSGAKENVVKGEQVRTDVSAIEKAMFELEYELLFNKKKSLFRLIDKSSFDDFNYKMAISISGGNNKYYVDNEQQSKTMSREYNGQFIHVVSAANEYAWNILNETKKIGNYLCYKATTHIEYYSEVKKATISFDPVVWFTRDIPFAFGPKELSGLPGLILEGTYNGRLYYYATEVQMKSGFSEKDITLKEKGKVMSKEAYEVFLAKNK